MIINNLVLGQLASNSYIVRTNRNNAIIIDIGGEPERVLGFLSDNGLTLKKILLTHGHYDHYAGVSEVQRATGAEVFIHTADAPKLTSAAKSLSFAVGENTFSPVEEFTTLEEDDIIELDDIKLKVLHTPGHTVGCVCFIGDDVIFSGDTLFRLLIGRTDFPGSSYDDMMKSLKKLAMLSGEYIVYPGHSEATSLDFEKAENPYMKRDFI